MMDNFDYLVDKKVTKILMIDSDETHVQWGPNLGPLLKPPGKILP